MRKNEIYEEIVEELTDALREHQGLRALNAAWRKKEIEEGFGTLPDKGMDISWSAGS